MVLLQTPKTMIYNEPPERLRHYFIKQILQ